MLSSGQRFRCVRTAFALCTTRGYTQKRVVDRYARSGGSQEKIKIDPSDLSHFERRLFVSNIAQDATWKDLKDHFRGVGATFVSLSKDQVTGQSKGCGIVQFDDPALVDPAVDKMNGTDLMGRCIVVRRDLKRNASGKSSGGALGHAPGASSNSNSSTLHQEPRSDSYWKQVHDEPRTGPLARQSTPRMDSTRINRDHTESPQEVTHGQAPPTRRTSNKSTSGPTTRDPRDEIYIAPSELERIKILLEKRDQHRANQNYEFADALQVTLRNKHRVHCEDADGLWRILPPVTSKGAIRRDNMKVNNRSYSPGPSLY